VQRLQGWSTALVSGASTLTFVAAGVLSAFTHSVIERIGPKLLVLLGAGALSASLVMIAYAAAPWQLYSAFLLMSLAWLGMGLPAITIILSQWFQQRRGLALSLALNGASFGGLVAAPLVLALTAALGFTRAMLATAALIAILIVPSAFVWIRRPPAPPPVQAAASGRQPLTQAMALRDWGFWTICASFALVLLAQIGFIVHQIAMLDPIAGRAIASMAVVLTTGMAIVGRLSLGAFVDRIDPRLASATSFTSQAWALLMLAMTDDPVVMLACCALFGFSVGNVITLPPLILQREYPPESFGMLMGLATAAIALISALGPGIIGFVRDLTGDYTAGLFLSVVIDAVAAIVVMQGGLRRT
jgi:MFS family permease